MSKTIQKALCGVVLSLVAATASAVPIMSDVPISLTIEFDNFPSETAFGIWESGSAPTGPDYVADPNLAFTGIAYDVGASSPIGFGDGYVLPQDFTGQPANVPFTFVWNLAVGNYDFIITDTFADGICCDFGVGTYSISANGDVIYDSNSQATFSSFQVTEVMAANVSEPGVLALFSLGLVCVGLSRRRKVGS